MVNFCVAVLISKVKENTPQSQNVMLYFKKGKDTTKMQKKKKKIIVYGEHAVTDRTCLMWFAKFHAGDFLLDNDAPWLARPVEVEKDQIETLTENNQCSTTWKIANILKISTSIKL